MPLAEIEVVVAAERNKGLYKNMCTDWTPCPAAC